MWRKITLPSLAGPAVAGTQRRPPAAAKLEGEIDPNLRELAGRLARLARQFHWLGAERVAADLLTISKELLDLPVPAPAARRAT